MPDRQKGVMITKFIEIKETDFILSEKHSITLQTYKCEFRKID